MYSIDINLKDYNDKIFRKESLALPSVTFGSGLELLTFSIVAQSLKGVTNHCLVMLQITI